MPGAAGAVLPRGPADDEVRDLSHQIAEGLAMLRRAVAHILLSLSKGGHGLIFTLKTYLLLSLGID